jgi:hypothetical protein
MTVTRTRYPWTPALAGTKAARNCDDRGLRQDVATSEPHRRFSYWRSLGGSVKRALETPPPMPEDERRAVLLLTCGMIRGGHYDEAEGLLTLSLERCPYDARALNLMGIVNEARRDWRTARKFFGRAMAADGRLADAQQNMRRIFELFTFGDSREPIALGDENEDGRVPVLHALPAAASE